MTEAEWLASTDVQAMYVFLRDATTLFRTRWQGYRAVPRFAFSERKSRLFAVACCRRILHLLPREARHVVEASEDFADSRATEDYLSAIVARSARAWEERCQRLAAHGSRVWRHEVNANDAVTRVHRSESAGRSGVTTAAAAARVWAAALDQNLEDAGRVLVLREYARQADLLRDIVGNPFRPSAIAPSWLAWNDRCVERMARGIYEERAFDRTPILHDALLDAGCDDEAVLTHCRKAEGHVRGCWVIDLLLGKE